MAQVDNSHDEMAVSGFDWSAPVEIYGGGLAGVEAALALARRGRRVRLLEMKPVRFSPAHKSDLLAELVCSNSLKSTGLAQASGLLQEEMRLLGSAVIDAALKTRVAAGQALAVQRDHFSSILTEAVSSHPMIELIRGEAISLPLDRHAIVATGPLTSDAMAAELSKVTGSEALYFYDAMAPIVEGDSIDRSIAFLASRYGKGGDDYLNCPMTKDEFDVFYEALMGAEKTAARAFEEEKVFSACQPIETIALSGPKTLRFGPMKPVGLVDPRTGERPYAAVQLRREDEAGLRWSMVGFQTKLKYHEQERVMRLIPGLGNAVFHRLGSLHRNTYVDGPKNLDLYLRLRKKPWIQLAGQITGVEGYLESAVTGLWAGLNLALRLEGKTPSPPPAAAALGALLSHVSLSPAKKFEPMNINFGLLPPLGEKIRDKELSKTLRSNRALEALGVWIEENL